jgi:hypothetical protein
MYTVQSWKLIRRQNNNLPNVPPSPLYNVDQHCVWGGGGTILAVDISIFNKWPPTMLNMYAFYGLL